MVYPSGVVRTQFVYFQAGIHRATNRAIDVYVISELARILLCVLSYSVRRLSCATGWFLLG